MLRHAAASQGGFVSVTTMPVMPFNISAITDPSVYKRNYLMNYTKAMAGLWETESANISACTLQLLDFSQGQLNGLGLGKSVPAWSCKAVMTGRSHN